MDGRLITAKEVAEDLECSMQHAYKIVRMLNEELGEMGCITMRGKTNRSYYEERLFGRIDEIDLSELRQGPAMSVRKDEKRGTWLVKLHYTNHDGETIDSTKRGFKTKTEALAWERDFLANG